MKNLFTLFILLVITFFNFTFSQVISNNFWKDADESKLFKTSNRFIIHDKYRTLELDYISLKSFLSSIPSESNEASRKSKQYLTLPMPDNSMQRFEVYESSIMEDNLAERYPEIRTYLGFGIDDPYASIRFDFTPDGFHAIILSQSGRVFIDPFSKGDIKNYISYYSRDYFQNEKEFYCEVKDDFNRTQELGLLKNAQTSLSIGPELKQYRIAISATGEYTTFHGGTIPQALAAIVTTLNRINAIYETEVGVRMILVSNNDQLIFTDPATDPFTNYDGDAMLAENQTTVDSRIGSANYDIGHVFSTGGGGIAYLGVVCFNGYKAQGVTGSSSPVGDPFDVDYVAHEIGHQFGANHTFNGSSGNCSGSNRNPDTAYEPGSGSTIMAYAGICSPQNLQSHSDPYFHSASFDEIVSYVNSVYGNGCVKKIATGNNAPLVTVPPGGFYIPKSTPFYLTGSATDPENDALTYCWEEFDLGPTGAPETPSGNAPIFRSWTPTNSPTRFFPRLQDLISNTSVKGEILPTYSRTLTFRLIARDNKAGGGGVNYSNVLFFVDAEAGPFVVTSPNTNLTWQGNSVQNITWNVANTDLSSVSCTNVKILLSLDGGFTYPITLAENTPNDGSENVTIPDTASTQARIKVEAVGNIFFDISNQNFVIEKTIPVELISFAATNVEEGIKLEWSTATETNNAGFAIERNFNESGYKQIGFVNGNGSTTFKSNYSYLDKDVLVGGYSYRLKQIDFDGTFKYLTEVKTDILVPRNFELTQNYPNPFNPVTTIKFHLPIDAKVTLNIFNTLGQNVNEVINSEYQAGIYEINFDASNFSNGIYFYTLTALGKDGKNFASTRKMILMK
jgi:hypothetical protein